MGERTSYDPGTFSYAELATSDAEAAQAFYTRIFGWTYDSIPIGDDLPPYHPVRLDGKQVAALFQSDQPPHWNCYVTVASAADASARAAELGASVVMEPFDVMGLGEMAVISDPSGAVLSLWEAKQHIGSEFVNAPGALAWNDLITPDPETAVRFYGELFGWTFQEMPDSGGYRVIFNGDRSNGGIFPNAEVPQPAWMPYFGHEDIDGLLGELDGLGGRLFNGPVTVPAGRFAVLADPQGAMFAVLTGDYDD
jgi:predicted enzyme related to lactoylglutathione lyase